MTHKALPKISIITVCYNEAAHIRDTCESVKNQTYSNLEWIVVDGGSNDGTIEILGEYRDAMAYFVSEKDKGMYDAMNKAILKASGDYLLFLNGGDYLAHEDILTDIFQDGKKAEADILYGDICLKDGRLHKSLKDLERPSFGFFLWPKSLNHQATFIRRQLFDLYGLYDDGFRYAADYAWFLRVFAHGKDVVWQRLDHVVSIFDQSGMSENRALRPKIYQEIRQAQEKADLPLPYRFGARALVKLREVMFHAYVFYKKYICKPAS